MLEKLNLAYRFCLTFDESQTFDVYKTTPNSDYQQNLFIPSHSIVKKHSRVLVQPIKFNASSLIETIWKCANKINSLESNIAFVTDVSVRWEQ